MSSKQGHQTINININMTFINNYYLSTYVMFFMLSFTMNVARFSYLVAVRHREGTSINVLTSPSIPYVNLKPSYSSQTAPKHMILQAKTIMVLYIFIPIAFYWLRLLLVPDVGGGRILVLVNYQPNTKFICLSSKLRKSHTHLRNCMAQFAR